MKHKIYIESKTFRAFGTYDETNHTIEIMKGSTFNPEIKSEKEVDSQYVRLRNELKAKGIVNESEFLNSYVFSAPSTAASFVLSKRGNYRDVILETSRRSIDTLIEPLDKLKKGISEFENFELFDNSFNQEKYKLEMLLNYKKHWDINASDFFSMLSKSMKQDNNIFQSSKYFPLKSLLSICKNDPEKIRSLFKYLYDESLPLGERLEYFSNQVEEQFNKIKGRPSDSASHKDLRIVTVYLTFEYPEKYYFYKSTEGKKFIELFFPFEFSKLKGAPAKEKVILFNSIMNRLLALIQNYPTIINRYKQKLLENNLTDSAMHFLVFNVYWHLAKTNLKTDEKMGFWEFSEESFEPIISKQTFSEILSNPQIINEQRLNTLVKIATHQKDGISIKELANLYGGNEREYQGYFLNLAKDINEYLKLNYKGPENAQDWPLIGKGKRTRGVKSNYRWALKDNLFQALNEKGYLNNISRNSYILPWNPSTYNLEQAIDETNEIYWGDYRSQDYEIGDIVYFYASDKIKQIVYQMEVVKSKINPQEISLPDPYWLKKTDKDEKSQSYFAFKPLKKNTTNKLKFSDLKNLGMEAIEVRSPKNISDSKFAKLKKELENVFLPLPYLKNEPYPIAFAPKKYINNLNQILYGPPGTGKTYWTAEYALAMIENRLPNINQNEAQYQMVRKKYQSLVESKNIIFTTFHQSYTYEDFVEALSPSTNKNSGINFEPTEGVFKRLVNEALNRPNESFVIIIDEINRGNISRIFGELITLLEPDKRLGEENAITLTLPVSKKPFTIPNNIFILGTMNTADKSISMVDSALRRRFYFVEMPPQSDLLLSQIPELKNVMDTLNLEIKGMFQGKKDLLIGHAYFLNTSMEKLVETLNHRIIPLLYEYMNDREDKVKIILEALKKYNIKIIEKEFGRLQVEKA